MTRSLPNPSSIAMSLVLNESFNEWGRGGCRKFVPVFGEDGTKVATPGEKINQPYGGMGTIRGKLSDHVGDHVVLSPEEAVLGDLPGDESVVSPPNR